MTFNDGKEDITIKKYEKNNNNYFIEYLDGDCIIYYNSDKNHEEKIKNDILLQIGDRDKKYFDSITKKLKISIIELVTLQIPFILNTGMNSYMFCLLFIINIYLIKSIRDNKKKLDELKKYRLYLEMKNDLEKKENADITKIIEFDPFYRKPINLSTIDEFSLYDMKLIKKELKRRMS